MKYTIGTAAKATGKAKSTISRDLKDGTLSADKNDDGSYSIDASELIRVYPDVFDPNRSENTISNDPQPIKTPTGTEGLQAEVERLRERLSVTGIERDRERQQLTNQIEDLRRRLDSEGEERRKLTAILTDQRQPPPAPEPPPPAPQKSPQGLWGRVRYLATGKS
jgi:hypothetical protein